MLTERDEFLLSRLTDGDLNEDEHAHVQTLLASSAAARGIADSYGVLASQLAPEPLPELDFAAGADAVIAAVGQESVAIVTRSPSFWQQAGRRLAVAAALLVGVSAGIHFLAPPSPTAPSATAGSGRTAVADLTVTGPTAGAAGASFDVQIGPSSAVAGLPAEKLYADELNRGRSRVEIRPESQSAKDAPGHDPF